MRRRQYRGQRRLLRDLHGGIWLRLSHGRTALPQDGVRRPQQRRRGIVRRRQHRSWRRLQHGLQSGADLHRQPRPERLHLALWRRPEAARGGMRRRQPELGRRLLVGLQARTGLELHGRRGNHHHGARHLSRHDPVERHQDHGSAAASQFRGPHALWQGGQEHRPRRARVRSQAAVQLGGGHDRVHDHQRDRFQLLVSRLQLLDGRDRHPAACRGGERHLRLRPLWDLQPDDRRLDDPSLLPPRRSWLGHAAGRAGDPVPREQHGQRPAQLLLHQRGALLVRVPGRRGPVVHRRRRRLGLPERPAGGGSRWRAPGVLWQHHARCYGRHHIQPHRGQDLRDRRLSGRTKGDSVELQADPGPVQPHAHRLHPDLRRRRRQRHRELRQRHRQLRHGVRRLHDQVHLGALLRRRPRRQPSGGVR